MELSVSMLDGSTASKSVRKSCRYSKTSLKYTKTFCEDSSTSSTDEATQVSRLTQKKAKMTSSKHNKTKQSTDQTSKITECNRDVFGKNSVKLFPIFCSSQNSQLHNNYDKPVDSDQRAEKIRSKLSTPERVSEIHTLSIKVSPAKKKRRKKDTSVLGSTDRENETMLNGKPVIEPDDQNKPVTDSIKNFPIFNTSLSAPRIDDSPPKLEIKVKKKRKIDLIVDVNDSMDKEKVKDVKQLKIQNRCLKKLKTSAGVGAAILRTCSRSKSKEGKKSVEDLNLLSLGNELEVEDDGQVKRKKDRPKKIVYTQVSSNNKSLRAAVLKKRNVVKPAKLFPLFTKTHATIIKNKSIMLINSKVEKRVKRCNSDLNTKEQKSLLNENKIKSDKAVIEVHTSQRRSLRSRKVLKIAEKSTIKKQTIIEKESEDIILSDESDREVKVNKNISNLNIKSESVLERSVEYQDVKVVHTEKQRSSIAKIAEMSFPFPLYSHYHCTESTSDDRQSQFTFNNYSKNCITIPAWNSIFGLTNLKKNVNPDNLSNKVANFNVKNRSSYVKTRVIEDICLWTDMKSDYNLQDGVSESSISELTSWLLEWKSKFNKGIKIKPKYDDDSFDSHSYDSNDSDGDGLTNSVILTGPPGCGKTSLIFSLANEHGFKVLEVNASSMRSGRNISHQLKEALESYHVEQTVEADLTRAMNGGKIKVEGKKSFNNYFKNKNETKEVTPKGKNKTSSVKNFFHVKGSEGSSVSKRSVKVEKSNRKMEDVKKCTISSQTIILFDDMDVVFEEDEGLWSTIRGFLKISKKPVIFTVSRNLSVVKANLDKDIRVLNLKSMTKSIVVAKLYSQHKKYQKHTLNFNVDLLTTNLTDIRRNLLHAQFWSQSTEDQKLPQSLSVNTFSFGSSELSLADFRSYILNGKLENLTGFISNYHQIGYDILHSNVFSIFNVSNTEDMKRQWESIRKSKNSNEYNSFMLEETQSDDLNKIQPLNGIATTDLWKEACEAFELKKQALKKGSSSKDLFQFSSLLDNYSFCDTLKGPFVKNQNWISLPERIKQWSTGLPMHNESHHDLVPHDWLLDAVSSIQVLGLQGEHKKYIQTNRTIKENKTFFLEHPFPNFDCSCEHLTEKQLSIVAEALPPSLILSKANLNLDYLSTLKIMCSDEVLRQSISGKRSNRFLHYFDSISLLIDKAQVKQILNS